MIERKSWEEFRNIGLLWWVNRILHLFGWAIVAAFDDDENLTEVYPARVKFRGFSDDCEEKGFINLSRYLQANIKELIEEAEK